MTYKSAGAAAVLSFFITGLGQIYNGEIGKAVLFWLVEGFLFWFSLGSSFFWLLFIGGWIWGIIDAYGSAEQYNLDIEDEERARDKRMAQQALAEVKRAMGTDEAQDLGSAPATVFSKPPDFDDIPKPKR